ncbi:hypothetical protein [Demequina sp. NBRC 110055]|uniref:hypothetical protein n=1 Tax=Demequina sp. NBRC 110055 TaxID=1570344 RepID=UPI0009FFAFD0|nr:hypothetical protein [Demequina sp. NBRC 110055]
MAPNSTPDPTPRDTREALETDATRRERDTAGHALYLALHPTRSPAWPTWDRLTESEREDHRCAAWAAVTAVRADA